MPENEDDPFQIFNNTEAPKEADLHGKHENFTEKVGENGEVILEAVPSPYARQFAWAMAGSFKALQETGEFSREEALKVLLQSMSAVVVHAHPDEDDDDEDD